MAAASGAGAPETFESESDLVAATLAWCAQHFGTPGARFVRPAGASSWTVVTWLRGAVSSHHADDAEIAMAWMVALGRRILLVARPRVGQLDGSSIRPISARSYLGIPVVCRDRVLGVIEVAGSLPSDTEAIAQGAQARVDRFAARLAFDASLQPQPQIHDDTRLAPAGGTWAGGDVQLSADEVRLVAALSDSPVLSDAATEAGIFVELALPLARRLLARGMLVVVD